VGKMLRMTKLSKLYLCLPIGDLGNLGGTVDRIANSLVEGTHNSATLIAGGYPYRLMVGQGGLIVSSEYFKP
jgi:hypothetical protein